MTASQSDLLIDLSNYPSQEILTVLRWQHGTSMAEHVVLAANPLAERLYGYRPGTFRRGISLLALLDRLRPWMAPQDFAEFIEDQERMVAALDRSEVIFARVPIAVGLDHPDKDMRLRTFLPNAICSSKAFELDGKVTQDTLIASIDLDRFRQAMTFDGWATEAALKRRIPPDTSIDPPQMLPTEAAKTRATPASTIRTRVFVSYSRKDEKYLEEFRDMLSATPLKDDLLDIWDDTRLAPGDKWEDAILAALQAAKVAVLLVSANFFASAFITTRELPLLLKAAEEGVMSLTWIYVGSCPHGETAIGKYTALHGLARPLDMLGRGRRAAILNEACDKLLRVWRRP